jgi:hypothetical protein
MRYWDNDEQLTLSPSTLVVSASVLKRKSRKQYYYPHILFWQQLAKFKIRRARSAGGRTAAHIFANYFGPQHYSPPVNTYKEKHTSVIVIERVCTLFHNITKFEQTSLLWRINAEYNHSSCLLLQQQKIENEA